MKVLLNFKRIRVEWMGWIVFIAILSVMISQHKAIVSINDDWTVWNLLRNGESRVLILSLPMAQTLVWLYSVFPSGQWYSLILLCGVVLSFANVLYAFNRYSHTSLYKYGVVFSLIAFSYLLMNLSVSTLTVLLILSAFLRSRTPFFWLSVSLAFLLRIEVAVTLVPVGILIALFLHSGSFRSYFISKKVDLLIILPILIYTYNSVALSSDTAYSNWRAFNSARAYFLDYNGLKSSNTLPHDMVLMLNVWWLGDSTLLPSETLINAAKEKQISVVHALYDVELKRVILLLLIPIVFFLLNQVKFVAAAPYIGIVLVIFILTNFRDVERITLPLLFISLTAVSLKMMMLDRDRFALMHLYLTFVSIAGALMFINTIAASQANEKVKAEIHAELTYLAQAFPHRKYEISIMFPMPIVLLDIALQDNPLFDEKTWVDTKKFHLMSGGWMQRHPYWYKEHNLSQGTTDRKYVDYMQMIIDRNMYFIGSKGAKSFVLDQTMMKIINQHYRQDHCKYKLSFSSIAGLKYLELAKIRKNCE